MVIKLDMENDFDNVKHSFLFQVLEKLGFDPPFIQWIKACIVSPWISPLINRRPKDFFQSNRGLKQGFLMSHLFLVHSGILLENLRIHSTVISLGVSNHKSISLRINIGMISQFLFNSTVYGFMNKKFIAIIKYTWKEQVRCSPFYPQEEKLRRRKINMKKWAKTNYISP